MKYLQVMISSELRTQLLRPLDRLIRKRLIFGGPVGTRLPNTPVNLEDSLEADEETKRG